MDMWTVYDHPVYAPDCYVARLFIIGPNTVTPTNNVFAATDLDELRNMLPKGLYCFPRKRGDEPQILEVWI